MVTLKAHENDISRSKWRENKTPQIERVCGVRRCTVVEALFVIAAALNVVQRAVKLRRNVNVDNFPYNQNSRQIGVRWAALCNKNCT